MEILVDGHCDTIEVAFDKQKNIDDKSLNFNLKDAKKPMIQMMATFISPEYKNSFKRAKDIINYFYKQYEKFSDEIILVKTKEDKEKVISEQKELKEKATNKILENKFLNSEKSKRKLGILLTIENGRAIENDLKNVDYFYDKGIRVMSINWNEDNLLGCGALTKNDIGLTELGKQYINKLNEKNIIIDISHSSPKTFWDTAKLSEKPIVATHSCCIEICNHPRNLTDEQIKQIAKMNGIIGICYSSTFLSEKKKASSKEIVKHISYIANLVGIDYVGLGSDFDGLEEEHLPTDIKGIKDIDKIKEELKNVGFTKEEIAKIWGENWLRVLRKNLV